MSRRKKITIIVLIVVVILLGLFLFLEFGEQATPDQPANDQDPIFPFATTSEFFDGGDDDGIGTGTDPSNAPADQPRLWKISDDPVAGSRWINIDTQNSDRVWFIKKETGFLFSANPQSREVTQLTDTRIPQVREAIIGPAGQTAVYRYLGDDQNIQTYQAQFSSTGGNNTYDVTGSFLPENIYAIDISPDGSQIFYLREIDNNQTVGILYDISAGNGRQVFSSDISSWRIDFNQPNEVVMFTPPADDVTGYGYRLNLSSGTQTKITDGPGLMLQPNTNNSSLLVADQEGNNQFITDTRSNNVQFSIQTFADKCGWADADVFFCGVPTEQNPDSINTWYQGRINFTDNLAVFNINNSNRDELFSADQIEQASADMVDISVNNAFQDLIFTDRTTGDLWGYEL